MERVDLAWQFGDETVRQWRQGWVEGPFLTTITLGRLADGRWYAGRRGWAANRRDKREGACVYSATDRGERLAKATARRWMRTFGGTWVEA